MSTVACSKTKKSSRRRRRIHLKAFLLKELQSFKGDSTKTFDCSKSKWCRWKRVDVLIWKKAFLKFLVGLCYNSQNSFVLSLMVFLVRYVGEAIRRLFNSEVATEVMDESLDISELLRRANNKAYNALISDCNLDAEYGGLTLLEGIAMSLTAQQKKTIFEMYSKNMQAFYEDIPSWGWDASEKKKDLFRSTSRFLLLVNPDNHDEVHAFTMFRFEWDDEDEPGIACDVDR